ncbi:MAG: hypothetical protein H6722_17305 [Sandaracinus sp.]|nr:hypothetical protein [Sandaracinus sp.]MCB9614198.1 hypothetical protein [Sandaracinus sp.]MCB9620109.1 hypothetical protein [Sandaracinus sp.]MCB9622519.1 hypothetical protein [Sandaracinus sp.]
MKRAVWILAVVWATAGCSKSEEVCTGPRVSRDAVVPYDALKEELCRYLARCDPDDLRRFVDPTVEGCIAYERCDAPSPEGFVVTPACLEALRTAPCEGEGLYPPGYEVLWSHECTLGGPFEQPGEGEGCGSTLCRPGGDAPPAHLHCADGLYCDRDDVCRRMVPVGEPCDLPRAPGVVIDPCETGAYCDFLAGVCRARLAPGATCETLVDDRHDVDPCRSPARCEEGVCTSPVEPPPPDYADVAEACENTDDCLRGLACVDGVCAALVCGGNTGDPCEPGTCSEGQLCHERKARCEPVGEPCDDLHPDCPAGTYCADSLTCQSL